MVDAAEAECVWTLKEGRKCHLALPLDPAFVYLELSEPLNTLASNLAILHLFHYARIAGSTSLFKAYATTSMSGKQITNRLKYTLILRLSPRLAKERHPGLETALTVRLPPSSHTSAQNKYI